MQQEGYSPLRSSERSWRRQTSRSAFNIQKDTFIQLLEYTIIERQIKCEDAQAEAIEQQAAPAPTRARPKAKAILRRRAPHSYMRYFGGSLTDYKGFKQPTPEAPSDVRELMMTRHGCPADRCGCRFSHVLFICIDMHACVHSCMHAYTHTYVCVSSLYILA